MPAISPYIKRPSALLVSALKRLKLIVPDKQFVKIEYRLKMGYWPNLKNPELLSEKIQWLKIYDRNPHYTALVDKVEAKKHVARIIGEEYIIPTLGVWESVSDIDLDELPEQFVLKTNHRGGGIVFICKDKKEFDFDKVKKKLKHQLRKNMYRSTKEWPYKNVERRILCEKYMVDESGSELKDYKFYCFNGSPRFCQVVSNRFSEESTSKDVYDTNWQLQEFSGPFGRDDVPATLNEPLERPEGYDKMLEIASQLSQGLPFARIDLYNINGKIYFGEITFYPASGLRSFYPAVWNKRIGDWLNLPQK